ncbi:MAG: restriction endonuclease subunit S [Roseovarius sp.]|nr:restriction endonuclease subunit S [Roseovarius sp.]
MVNEGARAGRFNISIDKFLSIDVWKPSSPEQELIAECLASIDALIHAEAEKRDALKDHKQGLLVELFPVKGETLPKRRFPNFQDPEGWVEKPLGEIADYENGKAYEKDIEEDGDFVVVNARFISTDGEVRKYSNERYCIASKGDVLMVLSDLPKGRALAKCFLVDEDERYAVNQRVSRLTAHSIDSTFLYYALDRHPFLLAFNDGLNQTHLSKGSVLECPIAFPLDENEQAKIVATLKAVDEQIRSQAEKVERLKNHKLGLLQQLFPILDEVEG